MIPIATDKQIENAIASLKAGSDDPNTKKLVVETAKADFGSGGKGSRARSALTSRGMAP